MIFVKSFNGASGGCAFTNVYALSTINGSLVWDSGLLSTAGIPAGGDYSTPAVADGTVFFGAGNTLYAYSSTSQGPILTVAPTSLDFGTVTINTSKDLTFTAQNTGGGTLIGSMTTSAPFSIVGSTSFSLTSGQSQIVTVRFTPTSAITFNGNVSVSSNGGNASVTLSGTGTTGGGGGGTPPTATWTTPPPSSVTAGQNFTIGWTTTGSPTHVNIHWNPTDPLAASCCLGTQDTTDSSTVSPTTSPTTLTAPTKNANGTLITSPTTVKYAVHVSNSAGAGNSTIVSVTVNPPTDQQKFHMSLDLLSTFNLSDPLAQASALKIADSTIEMAHNLAGPLNSLSFLSGLTNCST